MAVRRREVLTTMRVSVIAAMTLLVLVMFVNGGISKVLFEELGMMMRACVRAMHAPSLKVCLLWLGPLGGKDVVQHLGHCFGTHASSWGWFPVCSSWHAMHHGNTTGMRTIERAPHGDQAQDCLCMCTLCIHGVWSCQCSRCGCSHAMRHT